MRNIIILATLLTSTSVFADVFVNGYFKRNGIYVQPHFRSSPDISTFNNFSSWGNINPYTGKWGTSNPVTQEIYKTYRNFRAPKIYSIMPYTPIIPFVGGISGGGSPGEFRDNSAPHQSPIYSISK
jgi:hypothetical protein